MPRVDASVFHSLEQVSNHRWPKRDSMGLIATCEAFRSCITFSPAPKLSACQGFSKASWFSTSLGTCCKTQPKSQRWCSLQKTQPSQGLDVLTVSVEVQVEVLQFANRGVEDLIFPAAVYRVMSSSFCDLLQSLDVQLSCCDPGSRAS